MNRATSGGGVHVCFMHAKVAGVASNMVLCVSVYDAPQVLCILVTFSLLAPKNIRCKYLGHRLKTGKWPRSSSRNLYLTVFVPKVHLFCYEPLVLISLLWKNELIKLMQETQIATLVRADGIRIFIFKRIEG